jgi:hypothetical protein
MSDVGKASAPGSDTTAKAKSDIRKVSVREWLRLPVLSSSSSASPLSSPPPQLQPISPLPLLVLSESYPPFLRPWIFPHESHASQVDDGGAPETKQPQEPSSSIVVTSKPPAALLRVVHIPLPELVAERSFELPPRDVGFVVLIEPERLEAAAEFLILDKTPSTSDRKMKRPWSVAGAVLDTPDAQEELRLILVMRPRSFAVPELPYNLWMPNPLVQKSLLPLLAQELQQQWADSSRRRLIVWDLGSGAGRDVAFLASQLLRVEDSSRSGTRDDREGRERFRVVGLDQRYSSRDAAVFRAFMRRQGVEDVTEARRVDLSSDQGAVASTFRLAFEQEVPSCVYAVRYWNRLIFQLVRDAAGPGSIVAVSHFAKPAAGSGWPFSHPKVRSWSLSSHASPSFRGLLRCPLPCAIAHQEKHVLERNELRDLFAAGSSSWEVLRDEIVTDSDHGRTLVQFLAQRRAS